MTSDRVQSRKTEGVPTADTGARGDRKTYPWLSVITPVKDALPQLMRTWESLQSQDLAGVEWVIIDSSRDPQEVPSLLAGFPNVTYLWQAPQGIFGAMNRGITESTGQYVYFLNAGDTLAGVDSLTALHEALDRLGNPAWAFADVEMFDDQGRPHVTSHWDYELEKSRSFARGYFPCHQGTVVRATVLRSLGGFDTSYTVGGDYDLFLRLDTLYPGTKLPFTLARFEPGGMSSQEWLLGLREFHRARRHRLAPSGRRALIERVDTVWFGGRTALYRTLWAPGRPLHGVVRRYRD